MWPVIACAALGCSGDASHADDGDASTSTSSTATTGASDDPSADTWTGGTTEDPPVVPTPGGLRRLRADQYIGTVGVLLGGDAAAVADPPDDAGQHLGHRARVSAGVRARGVDVRRRCRIVDVGAQQDPRVIADRCNQLRRRATQPARVGRIGELDDERRRACVGFGGRHVRLACVHRATHRCEAHCRAAVVTRRVAPLCIAITRCPGSMTCIRSFPCCSLSPNRRPP